VDKRRSPRLCGSQNRELLGERRTDLVVVNAEWGKHFHDLVIRVSVVGERVSKSVGIAIGGVDDITQRKFSLTRVDVAGAFVEPHGSLYAPLETPICGDLRGDLAVRDPKERTLAILALIAGKRSLL